MGVIFHTSANILYTVYSCWVFFFSRIMKKQRSLNGARSGGL